MNEKNINLTSAEWSVMECLWETAPLTGREITERMQKRCGWSRSTTLTLLGRMEAKGAVQSGSEEKKKTFSPLVSREEAALQEAETFLDRVYNGSLSLMVSAMTHKQTLSQKEVDELYALLKDLEGKKHD